MQGVTLRLFDNPVAKPRLLEMGLRPETAFGCALNFLLQPHPIVREQFAHEFEVLSNPSLLKIGIQVRFMLHWCCLQPAS